MLKFTIYSKINRRPLSTFKHFEDRIKGLELNEFNDLALELFHFQAIHNPVYHAYIGYLGRDLSGITNIGQIPFMPVEFFKRHKVLCAGVNEEIVYTSSGTTGQLVSSHYVANRTFYLDHATRIFQSVYGPLSNYHILALLPGYLEREGSSLIDMIRHFIQLSGDTHSGFYLHDHEALRTKVSELAAGSDRRILLFGVSFALMDLAMEGAFPHSEGLIVMETGGMKGRRKEILREELHEILCNAFRVETIHSEYGMTEALSQAYSKGNGIFYMPNSMRVLLRDPNDPLDTSDSVSRGAVNLIDLANIGSCSFLQLQDLAE